MKLVIENSQGVTRVTLDLPEGTDVKLLRKSVAVDPGDTVLAEQVIVKGAHNSGDIVRKPEEKKEVKNPYSQKSDKNNHSKWIRLKKKLGRPPTRKEMKMDWRGRSGTLAQNAEKENIAEEENQADEDTEGIEKELAAEGDPDQPMTDEMRYHNYVVKMKGEMPLCDECLNAIRKASDAKHAGGLFFHIKCWEDR